MKRFRKLTLSIILAVLLVFGAAGCSNSTGTPTSTADGATNITTAAGETNATVKYDEEDLDASWSEADADAIITLNGDSIQVDGSGAKADGSTVTISSGGLYIISGTLSAGQVTINAPSTDTVRIVLNGVDITAKDNAAIYAAQCDKLIITLAEGSDNRVTDVAEYTYADEASEEPDAAIFCKDDMTINGSGALSVNGNFYNGIGTKDDLVIVSGSYTVTAANNGIRGRDSMTILDGTFTIKAGNDGLQSNNDNENTNGWISIEGGTFNITAEHDGIQAETTLDIKDGTFNITAGGGSANAPERTQTIKGFGNMDGNFPSDRTPPEDGDGSFTPPTGEMPEGFSDGNNSNNTSSNDASAMSNTASATDEATTTDDASATDTTAEEDTDDRATSESYKGIKAGGNMNITGGTYTIDSADDALHSNANMVIAGGTFTLATGDDGAHADEDLTIGGNDTAIEITACYEGLEGNNVVINAGNISITADDDGINAAGGNDDSATNAFGADQFKGGGDHEVAINGGTITIDAGYDGIDSNGSVTINDGELYISGSLIGAIAAANQ